MFLQTRRRGISQFSRSGMRLPVVLAFALFVVACGKSDDKLERNSTPAKGRISGQLMPFRGASATLGEAPIPSGLRRALRAARERTQGRGKAGSFFGWTRARASEPPAVSGELIVQYEDGVLSTASALEPAGVPGVRALGKGRAGKLQLMQFAAEDGEALSGEKLQEVQARLEQLPGVRRVEPNRWLSATAVKEPNDPGYKYQWNYPAMNLPGAWGAGHTGSGSVVVAVIDSGTIPHPELTGERFLQGMDMVSDLDNAADGDGRDDDPTDEGKDNPDGSSTWHGAHVAGTIGGNSNDSNGVAGVAWNVRILPVRAVGRKGGTTFDVAAATQWALGEDVPGVRRNTTPAKVINMSLGAPGAPSRVLQDIIDRHMDNAIFVVAAGNEDTDASDVWPCNQNHVICVGAVGFSGQRSSYSNYGAPVDIMAPGGELSEDLNGDGYPDGILSTVAGQGSESSEYVYKFMEGTSMATPHVAGLVALMASQKPDLTVSQAEATLKASAVESSRCPEGCGAGLVDALAALSERQEPTGEAKLAVNTDEIFFHGGGSATLSIGNLGSEQLSATLTKSGSLAPRIRFPQHSGQDEVVVSVGPARMVGLKIQLDADGLEDGDHTGTLTIDAGEAGSARVQVTVRTGGAADKDAIIGFAYLDADGEWQVDREAVGLVRAADDYRYSIELKPRTYFVVATIDDDEDGDYFEDTDRVGAWSSTEKFVPIPLAEGEEVEDISFTLAPFATVKPNE
jgi:serine protease